jgi:hypothetical protein
MTVVFARRDGVLEIHGRTSTSRPNDAMKLTRGLRKFVSLACGSIRAQRLAGVSQPQTLTKAPRCCVCCICGDRGAPIIMNI